MSALAVRCWSSLRSSCLAPGPGAAAGEPDPSFGSSGFTIFDEPDAKGEFLTDLVVLPDGKILGAGGRGGASGFLLARFNSNGTPDLSFGGEGFKVEPDLGQAGDPAGSPGSRNAATASSSSPASAGLRSPDSTPSSSGAICRAASSTPSFGENGLTTVPMNEFGSAIAMDQAPDGKIVATGDKGTL